MSLTTRVLPAEDYGRLAGTELERLAPKLPRNHSLVLVVENEAGETVGCWALLSFLHVEGLWVRDDERRAGRVQRRLLTGMAREVHRAGGSAVMASVVSDEIAGYLKRIGASALPGTLYVLPLVPGGR